MSLDSVFMKTVICIYNNNDEDKSKFYNYKHAL